MATSPSWGTTAASCAHRRTHWLLPWALGNPQGCLTPTQKGSRPCLQQRPLPGGRRWVSSSSWVPVAWGTSFVNGVCQATHHGVQRPARPASVAWGWSLPPFACFPPPSLPLPCCPPLSNPKVGLAGQHLHRRAGEGRPPTPWLPEGPGPCARSRASARSVVGP